MNCSVSGSPHEERGIIANLGDRAFQFCEVCRPIPNDAPSMTKGVIFAYGYAVALDRIGRIFRSVAEQAAQPQVVERAPALNRVAENQGAEFAAHKRREPLAMR